MAFAISPRPAADPPRLGGRRAQLIANLTPNWFASVMGTGIVAVAATSLPWHVQGLHTAAVGMWLLAAGLLVALLAATAAHWLRHPAVAKGHAANPVMAHFYGAPPMAMLTVGAGALLLGRDVVGLPLALDIDWVLWFAGTLTGLATTFVVPYLARTRHSVTAADAFGGWLMPVVPPMVSAATGALLVPHTTPGATRLALLLACYAMFVLALVASLVMITLVCRRVSAHGIGPAAMVPTLFIVLGPLGQSITAVSLLGAVAHEALPARYATGLRGFAVLYGIPVWVCALGWLVFAAAATARTALRGLPFTLTWWSFTFPVGTVVTGTSALALHTGAELFRAAAAIGYGALIIAWAVVATRTMHGISGGTLFPVEVPASDKPT